MRHHCVFFLSSSLVTRPKPLLSLRTMRKRLTPLFEPPASRTRSLGTLPVSPLDMRNDNETRSTRRRERSSTLRSLVLLLATLSACALFDGTPRTLFPLVHAASSPTQVSNMVVKPESVSTITSTTTAATTTPADRAAERAAFVKQVLGRRLHYVQSGKRMSDFSKWVKQQEGDATAFSTHGIPEEEDDEMDMQEFALQKEQHFLHAPTQKDQKDPFAADRLTLELVLLPETPVSQYNGKQLHLLDLRSPSLLQLSFRAIRLGIHFAPVMSTVGFAVVFKRFRRNVWYGWVASCIGSAGASFTKWGQWAATRSDMFPEALCDCLATLHSDAPAHKWPFSKATVEGSLGLAVGTLNKVFDEFHEKPIASGSIAQIHKAVLDGQTLAIKIRHPRVAELMDMDFRLMTTAARIIDVIPALSWLHVRDSVEQFSHTMAQQAYLQVEAHHLEVLNNNFRGWAHVSFPRPLYASSAVIIETFEPGKIVTEVLDTYDSVAAKLNQNGTIGNLISNMIVVEKDDETDKAKETTPERQTLIEGYELIPPQMAKFVVTSGLGMYLKMLLVDNLMHADLHPGNIMIDVRNGKTIPGKTMPISAFSHENLKDVDGYAITLVDAGMVAKLTEEESSAFIGLLASLGEGDGKEAARFALQFSIENTMNDKERGAFVNDMVLLFAERCGGYGTAVNVGYVLRGVLSLIRKHQVRIDANFATLVVNALCIESLAARMSPTYNVLDAAQPLLQSYRRMCYDADGAAIPRAPKSKMVQLWLSFMYLKKNAHDDKFFRLEKKTNEKKKAIEKFLA